MDEGNTTHIKNKSGKQQIVVLLTIVLVAAITIELYFFWSLFQKSNDQDIALTSLRTEFASTTGALSDELYILESALQEVNTKNITLQDALQAERDRVEDLRDDVGDFERSIDTLEKLAKADPEMLQKYSKVYFLNEHFVPADLVTIDPKYDFENAREVAVHADMWPFLKDLLDDAWDDDERLLVLSGYRSFDEQSALKGQYTVTYGAGSANSFSADQGYSEHQLGTTVDFTTKEIGAGLDGFENTTEYTWLKRNAYKYGFILSYAENNGLYVFEPWHWRFVGKDLARYIDRKGTTFYELDQRKIDTYLPDMFD